MTTLFLVATPIGNLEDISPRALETLRAVSLIAAEDTRTAKQLLTYFEIHTPVTSFFEYSKTNKLERILDALERGDVAVVSEAGMPGINDPGYELVREAIARGHRVSPIPGPSAVLTALVASGLPAHAFYYAGFLPREPQARRRFLRDLVDERDTLVVFETPHRLRDALEDLENIFGAARRICVARELTKKFEEFQRGTIRQVRAYFQTVEPRGEFTLVIGGQKSTVKRPTSSEDDAWDDVRVKREFNRLIAQGMPRTDAVKRIAKQSGRERRAVYELTQRGGR
ncbi:MAG: 16S rRNA (cytidine(1402)-2'-O)-methyltransferase [Chloroflexi bacterium]|nr:16S rRNA (cytidine(1402)-2'-O)-methyltransferase [Chloroflexota bacterium]